MLCGWGVQAGMACLQVKLCVPISDHFRNAIGIYGALQMCRFTYFMSHTTQNRSFREGLPSQSLGLELKKLNLTQQKQTTKNKIA